MKSPLTVFGLLSTFKNIAIRATFYLSLFCILLTGQHAAAQVEPWLPIEQLTPGGIALIDISDSYQPGSKVFFNSKRVKVIQRSTGPVAIVGIPLSASTGVTTLTVRPAVSSGDQSVSTRNFILQQADYPTEQLTIADTNKVSPNTSSLKRIKQERVAINQALRNWQADEIDHRQMLMPVAGRLSSEFGHRRIINGQPRKPHSGIDIAAPTGTDVVAPAGGIISAVGHYFFNGATLFIDHGEGVVSMFCHLDETLVKPGDSIQQGELVARVGSSGRVTGPHLHWSLSLNDARINPLLFTSEKGQTGR